MGLNWKMPILTLYSPHNLQSRLTTKYFKSQCNRDAVSDKSYQYFHDKRLVRQGIVYIIALSKREIVKSCKFRNKK